MKTVHFEIHMKTDQPKQPRHTHAPLHLLSLYIPGGGIAHRTKQDKKQNGKNQHKTYEKHPAEYL
jgi:hypothetical protein